MITTHTSIDTNLPDADVRSESQQKSASLPGRPRVCLLGADYENTNLGIRALATGALSAVYSQHPTASVYMLEYGAEPRQYSFELFGKHVPVGMSNIRFSKKPWVKNHIARLIVTALMLRLFGRKAVGRNPWIRDLQDVDCVLSLNYGDSFSDIYGLQRFIYVCLPQVLAIVLGKPVIQLPQTIGPFKSNICRKAAEWLLARSELVYSRDEQAVQKVRAMVPAERAGRVRFCNDLAFVVAPKPFEPAEPALDKVFSGRPVVGFNVSGLLAMGGYTQANMFGLASDYNTIVRKAIAHFIEVKGANVLLVPHVLLGRGEGDPAACKSLVAELQTVYKDRIFTMMPPYDEREIKDVIRRCDFFVGARMHACIGALSQCVPAAAMAYSDKFIGVLQSVGMESTVADLRRFSDDQIMSVLSASFDNREFLRSILRHRIPEVQKVVFAALNELQFKSDR